jgi:tetratricopeptide (TPR) repeat protein
MNRGASRILLALLLLVGPMPAFADPVPPVEAAGELVDRAEALLDAGQAEQAYRLLDAQLAAFAGNARFDYILALAAIQAERPEAALIPLRRVIAADPAFNAARLELADLLARFDDPAAARAQYEAILANAPSALLRGIVEQRLEALPSEGPLGSLRLALEAGLGYDSNANGSTTEDSFQGVLLDPRLQAAASPFVNVGVSLRQQRLHGDRVATFWRASVAHRANTEASFLDQSLGFVQAGVNARVGRARVTMTLDGVAGTLDGRAYRRGGGLELGLAFSPGPRWEVAGVVRAGELSYEPLPLRLLDVDRLFGGVVVSRAGIGRVQARVGVAALGGQDRARRAGSPYSNDRYGARAFVNLDAAPRLRVAAEVAHLVSDYFAGGGFFGIDRLDRTTAAAISVQWRSRPVRGWTLGPQVVYTRNESNVALFRYERVETVIQARYEFR